MDRREFLKRAGCAGMVMAASQLPVFAEEKTDVFSQRGRFECLALNYGVVKIGLPRPFSVLHISDTHLSDAYPHESANKQTLKKSRTKDFGGLQEVALRDSLAWARKNVDYVIHTGDLIDWQSEANYDLVRKYFGENMTGALGNHEYTPDMWLSDPKEEHTEAFKDRTRAAVQEVYPFNTTFHSQVIEGVNFITLDDVYGYVTKEQVRMFKKEVRKGLPIVLCMHVPFYTENIWLASKRFWDSCNKKFRDANPTVSGEYKLQMNDPVTSKFIAYLKQEPLLKAIFAGHVHFTMQDKFSETATEFVTGCNFLFAGEEILFV